MAPASSRTARASTAIQNLLPSLPVHLIFVAPDDPGLGHVPPKFLPLLGVHEDLVAQVLDGGDHLLRGIVAVHAGQGRVDAEQAPFRRALEDADHGVFKMARYLASASFKAFSISLSAVTSWIMAILDMVPSGCRMGVLTT